MVENLLTDRHLFVTFDADLTTYEPNDFHNCVDNTHYNKTGAAWNKSSLLPEIIL